MPTTAMPILDAKPPISHANPLISHLNPLPHAVAPLLLVAGEISASCSSNLVSVSH
jgi:hypothetical protein